MQVAVLSCSFHPLTSSSSTFGAPGSAQAIGRSRGPRLVDGWGRWLWVSPRPEKEKAWYFKHRTHELKRPAYDHGLGDQCGRGESRRKPSDVKPVFSCSVGFSVLLPVLRRPYPLHPFGTAGWTNQNTAVWRQAMAMRPAAFWPWGRFVEVFSSHHEVPQKNLSKHLSGGT